MAMLLLAQIKEFLQEPKFYFLATRDENLNTDIVRGLGVQISSPSSLTVFVYEKTAEKMVSNLRDNKLVAFSVTNGLTHESYQIKGTLVEQRKTTDEEDQFVSRYMADIAAITEAEGLPEGFVSRIPYHPALAIEFDVEQIFEQTPKIGTGNILSAV